MGYLGIEDRPTVLRIALSKGIVTHDLVPESPKSLEKGREVPLKTICPDKNLVLIKHVIIHKLNKKISDKEIHKFIRNYLIYGINIMYDEVNKLDQLDNYLIYLSENIPNYDAKTQIKKILGYN